MARIEYIGEQVVLPSIPSTPIAGYVKIYQLPNGLWYELDSTGIERVVNWDRLRVDPILSPGIVIHNGAANSFTNAVTQEVVFPYDGDYIMDLNFQYNADATNTYVWARATFDGNPLGLDNRGNNIILNQRLVNSGNTSQGAMTGTGSGNEYSFGRKYILQGQTAGTKSFVLDIGGQRVGVNTAMWDVLVDFELKKLT